jgi:FkbM family methyltransferase
MTDRNERILALAATLDQGPALTVGGRYGPLSRAVWRVNSRLNRHADEHRAVVLRALLDEVGSLSLELGELRREVDEGEQPEANAGQPVYNHGSGALVLSRYRPALARVRSGEASPFDSVVAVAQSDLGPLLFPSFDRFMLPSVASSGAWEREEAEIIRQWLGPGATAVNVGANVGYTTMVMANAVGPDGLVLAFEPEPFNFSLLWENVRRNRLSNVLPIHAAVGERTGIVRLAQSPDNSGDHRTAPHPVAVGELDVPMIALDDLLPAHGRVDAVVIDAQGYDHRIIEGMTKTIDASRPRMLIEFWPPGIMELGDHPAAVLDRYRQLGYRIRVVTTGDESFDRSDDEIVTVALDGRDHVTLELEPLT